MIAQKIAAAYLGALFLVFLVKMVEINGLITVLGALAIVVVCVSVPVAFIVLLEEDAR